MKQKLKLFYWLTLAVLTAIFILQNMVQVELRFLFWSFTASRAWMAVILVFIGFLLGLITSSLLRRSHSPH